MPAWLNIVIAIISGIGTVLGIFGITSYMNKRMEHKAELKNQEEKRVAELKREAYKQELKEIIDAALLPIKEDLVLVKKGTQATCRNDLEEMFAIANKQGFCSNEDKQKFESTYQAYHSLGNNGVMDAKREKLLKMPETKCIRKKAKVLEKSKGE